MCEEKFNKKTAHLLSPSVAQKRCVLKPPNSSFLGRRGGGRGLRGCRESCYHKQGVALYRGKAKGDNLVCWRDNTGAINAFYVSCSMYILKFKERRIIQGIILRVSLSFQCNERFTQALAQFKLPWLFSPSSVTNHYSLSNVRPIL